MKIIVIGPLEWKDHKKVASVLSKLTKPGDEILVKGYTPGIAQLARDWATSGERKNWRTVKIYYESDLEVIGEDKSIKNSREDLMLREADRMICFGEPGRMVSRARKINLKVKVIS